MEEINPIGFESRVPHETFTVEFDPLYYVAEV